MEFKQVIKTREAVRKFKQNEQISKVQLDSILEAGRIAPTAKNIQPQRIIVVQSGDGLTKIDKASPCRYGAPTVLLVCSDTSSAFRKDGHSTYEVDACIVATHMMLQATDVGVDNIWIELFDRDTIKKEFELEEGVEPICLIPLGYRTEDYAGSQNYNNRKSLEETVIYR